MKATLEQSLQTQLQDRRARLAETMADVGRADDLVRLLTEVDSALARLGTDAFGLCEVCGEPCDNDDLRAHPMLPYCLCRLSPQQQSALQRDLDMAWRVQAALLPEQNLSVAGWQFHFRYQPAGPVSGDYCDVLLPDSDGDCAYFLVGDVSGKGVAASLLMAQLNAVVRSLVNQGVAVADLLEQANRHLSQSTLSSHFATLVCGKANGSGELEISNAGHCHPLVVRGSQVERLGSTGFPLGLGEGHTYGTQRVSLNPTDSIVLYTDGITEAPSPSNERYGPQALARVLAANHALSPARIADACLRDLASFQDGAPRADDLTIMVVRRTGRS